MQSNFFSCATGNRQAEYDVLDGFGQSAAGVQSAKAYMEKHWVSASRVPPLRLHSHRPSGHVDHGG